MKIILKTLSAALTLVVGYFFIYQNETTSKDDDTTSFEKQQEITTKVAPDSHDNINTPNIRQLELPGKMKGTPEKIIKRQGYTLSFNREHNQPNWVAWELTANETSGTVNRYTEFYPDPVLPTPQQVTSEDYKHSGYDRGHMAPAADMKWDKTAMKECFYMSNICPQNGSLNSGAWNKLESACRRWATQEGKVYIVCGPIFKNQKQKKIGKEHHVTVPDAFFKVVMSNREGKEKAIGFYYNNSKGKQNMDQATRSVDEIESITGIDFFVNLPDKLENRIESCCSLKDWQ